MNYNRSARTKKAVGYNEQQFSALDRLAKAKQNNIKRSEQYEIEDKYLQNQREQNKFKNKSNYNEDDEEDIDEDDYEEDDENDFIDDPQGYYDEEEENDEKEFDDDYRGYGTQKIKLSNPDQNGITKYFIKAKQQLNNKLKTTKQVDPKYAQKAADILNSLLENDSDDQQQELKEDQKEQKYFKSSIPKRRNLFISKEEEEREKYNFSLNKIYGDKIEEEQPVVEEKENYNSQKKSSSGDSVQILKRNREQFQSETNLHTCGEDSVDSNQIDLILNQLKDKDNNTQIKTQHKPNIYTQSQPQNKTLPSQASSTNYIKMPKESFLTPEVDGSLDVFWFDAYEDVYSYPGSVFLFGKVQNSKSKEFESCCIQVKNIQRSVFVFPKAKDYNKTQYFDLGEVNAELESIRRRDNKISKWAMKPCSKSYCFDLPVDHCQKRQCLQIVYSFGMPQLNTFYNKSKTFDCVLGTTHTALELLLLDRDLMGPEWVKIKNFTIPKQTDRQSWCKHEIIIENMEDLVNMHQAAPQQQKPSPPLSCISLQLKTIKNLKTKMNEIVMISINLFNEVQCDGQTEKPELKFQTQTLLRSPHNNLTQNFVEKTIYSKHNVEVVQQEKQLLQCFIGKINKLDPDVIVGHDLHSDLLERLFQRARECKVSEITRLGRLRQQFKKRLGLGQMAYIRSLMPGRLLCDTFLSSRELLKENDYSLTNLSQKQLNIQRENIESDQVIKFFDDQNDIIDLVNHNEQDSKIILKLMFNLEIIPLTKQLTNIAGNLWARSLQNSRAERNEMLLMHKFFKEGYVLPDKFGKVYEDREFLQNDQDEDAKEKSKKKRNKYSGGLVLEPKKGLYDDIILLLDFNSLYPSIIQEFNLCFTTVQRNQLDKDQIEKIKQGKINEEEEEEIISAMENAVEIPDQINQIPGILPQVIKNLIERRKTVKSLLKSEKDEYKKQMLDIKQKAIKLIANSMYGCLGFSSSRFYARQIAALITKCGRNILGATVKIVTEKFSYDVIYGDTDSIMLNSKLNANEDPDYLKKCFKIGKEITREVSRQYKCLDLEIDGIFKRMLLLKKKKYAAIKLENLSEVMNLIDNSSSKAIIWKKEMKGLDMVRRDWCQLSKESGNFVLDTILSDQNTIDDVVAKISAYMQELNHRIKTNKIEMKQFIITKQLTKKPSEYKNVKALPHVQVAKDRIQKEGLNEASLVDHIISYVICKTGSNALSEKAKHPEEVISNKLEIDYEWYLISQVLPPIQRLLEVIEGLSLSTIAQELGIDSSKYRLFTFRTDEGEDSTQQKHMYQKVQDRQHNDFQIAVKCTECKYDQVITGLFNLTGISQLVCKCKRKFEPQIILNKIQYNEQQLVCSNPICTFKAKRLKLEKLDKGNCPQKACGKLELEYPQQLLINNLKYLVTLFKYENIKLTLPIETQNLAKSIKNKVEEYIKMIPFIRINVDDYFSVFNK